jgi:hypothetical protein
MREEIFIIHTQAAAISREDSLCVYKIGFLSIIFLFIIIIIIIVVEVMERKKSNRTRHLILNTL